jgi:hypothetical protein
LPLIELQSSKQWGVLLIFCKKYSGYYTILPVEIMYYINFKLTTYSEQGK